MKLGFSNFLTFMKFKNPFIEVYTLVKDKFNKYLYLLFFFGIIVSVLELLSFGAFIPFIKILVSDDHKIISFISQKTNFTDYNTIIFFLLFLIILSFLIKNTFLIFFTWFQNFVCHNIYSYYSTKLFSVYLNQPYSFIFDKNSGELFRNVHNEINNFQYFILHSINLFTEIIIIISIISLIFYLQGIYFFYVGISLFLIIALFYFISKKKLIHWSLNKLESSNKFHRNLLEGFNAFKEIKIFNKEKLFTNKYNENLNNYINLSIKSQTIIDIPKFVLEFLVVIVFSLAILLMFHLDIEKNKIIEIFSILALALFRMLPSINRISFSIQNILNTYESTNLIKNEFLKYTPNVENFKSTDYNVLKNSLIFKNINFSYKNKIIFERMNLEINKNKVIGIFGPNGSGKSTLINLVTGLLSPDSGEIIFDDKKINYIEEKFLIDFSYVPQSVYLLDETIEKNITLVENDISLDKHRFKQVCDVTNLSEFVLKLPLGYQTKVGEKGIKMSGGQIQRIGIARALYKNSNIIILDEAFSNLDMESEKIFIDFIKNFKNSMTIIIVSHDDKIRNICDKIIELKDKKIIS
jgi:ABC-type bacteriocin/lantibiotic exporter with double-glycine peptidase domain